MKTKIIALLATGLLLMSLVGPAFAKMDKAMFCHATGNSIYSVVVTSEGSAHQRHADNNFIFDSGLPGENLGDLDDITLQGCLDLSL